MNVTYDEKEWTQVNLSAMGAKPVELFLKNKKTPLHQRMIITELMLTKPTGDLCTREGDTQAKIVPELTGDLRSVGWDCLRQVSGKNPQLIAKKVRSYSVAKRRLWAVVSTIEQGKTDPVEFKKWLAQMGPDSPDKVTEGAKKGSHAGPSAR